MADDNRKIFVEVVINDADARARLLGIDTSVQHMGQTAAQARAQFDALFQSTGQVGGAAGQAATATNGMAGALGTATGAARTHNQELKNTVERYREKQTELIKTTNILRTIGRDFVQAGMSMSLYFTMPIVAATTAGLKFATDFETNMTRVVTVSGVGEQQMREMRRAIQDLAPAVGIGPNALAEALLRVTSIGIRETAPAMDVVRVSAKGSAVGLGEVKDVADALTTVMVAYKNTNLDAAKAGDVLYGTVVEGKGELTEFAGSLSRVVGMAALTGVSMADVGTYMAAFTRTGASAAEAATALRRTMFALTIQEAPSTARALKELGLSFDDVRASIRDKGLTITLQELAQGFKGNWHALNELFPNIRALTGVLANTGNQAKDVVGIYENLKNGVYKLDEGFARVGPTIQQQWNEVKAQFENVAIALGERLFPALRDLLPAMETVGRKLVSFLEWFGTLPSFVQNAALRLIAVTAALGPLVFTLGNVARVGGAVVDTMIALQSAKAGAGAVAMMQTMASASANAAAGLKTVETAAQGATAALAGSSTAGVVAKGTFLGLTGPAWAVVAAIGALALGVRELSGSWTNTLLLMAPPLGMLKKSWDETGSLVLADILSIGKSTITIAWRALKDEIAAVGDKLAFLRGLVPGLDSFLNRFSAQTLDTTGLRTIKLGLEGIIKAQDEASKPLHTGPFAPESAQHALAVSSALWDQREASAALAKAHLEGAHAEDVLSGSGLPLLQMAQQTRDRFASLSEASAGYRAELQALTGVQRGQLAAALREGALSLQDIADKTGLSTEAIRLFQRQSSQAAAQIKKDTKDAQADTQKTIALFDDYYAKQALFMDKGYAEFLASMKKELEAKQGALVRQVELSQEYADKERQLGLTGTAAKLAQVDAQERAFLASAAKTYTGDSAMWQMMLANAQRYFDHLRRLASESSDTLIERMAASGIQTKAVLQQMADQAKRDYEQMRKDGEGVWTAPEIEAARQRYLDADAKARGVVRDEWQKNLSEIGGLLGRMFEGVNTTFAQVAKIAGEALETLFSKAVSGAAKTAAALSAVAAIADVMGNKILAAGASGAAGGAMIGSAFGPVGTAIGAVAGGLVGLFAGASASSKQAKAELQALRTEAQNLQAELLKTYGSFEQIGAIGKIIGVDLSYLWGASSALEIAAFKNQVDQFNKALEAQDARLRQVAASTDLLTKSEVARLQALKAAGYQSDTARDFEQGQIARVSQGALGLVSGFASPWLQLIEDAGTFAERTDQVSSRILDLKAKIADMDAKGGPATEQQMRNYTKWREEVGALTVQLDQMVEQHRLSDQQIREFSANGQEAFDRFGRFAEMGFAAAIAGGSTFMQALSTMGPGLDQLGQLMSKFGFKASSTLQSLLDWRQWATVHPELVSSLDSLNQMMGGLWNSGMMNETMFKDLGATAYDVFAKMTEQGKGGEQGMRAMQPTLQNLWQIWKDTGWAVDDNTRALIEQAEAAGIVGEQFKDPARKQVDALESIKAVLGDLTKFFREDFVQAIMDAFATTETAAQRMGAALDEELGRTRTVPVRYEDPGVLEHHMAGGGAVMHTGGVVGQAGGWRSAAVDWARVGRAHAGLAPDEIPVIAQRGERILSRADTARFEKQGGLTALRASRGSATATATPVQVTVVAWDASSVDTWLRRGGARQLARATAPATIAELDSRGLLPRR